MSFRDFFQLTKGAFRFERPKRSSLFWAFITAVVFLFLLWLAIKGYPWILGVGLFLLFPSFIINWIYFLYLVYKNDRYLQNNYFEIWEMGKSRSLTKRLETMKLVRELDDPYLKKNLARGNRFSETCLWIWLSLWLIFLLISGILWLTGTITFD